MRHHVQPQLACVARVVQVLCQVQGGPNTAPVLGHWGRWWGLQTAGPVLSRAIGQLAVRSMLAILLHSKHASDLLAPCLTAISA